MGDVLLLRVAKENDVGNECFDKLWASHCKE